MLWEGYRREEASWVQETEVTAAALRYLKTPHFLMADTAFWTRSLDSPVPSVLERWLNC